MTIYLATDHAGFELKNHIKGFLVGRGCEVEDCGAYHHDPLDDFPDFIAVAARAVAEKPAERRAVIFGGSGQGEAMLANRFPGVRATVFYGGDMQIIELSRQHNDANVLSLGARFMSAEEAEAAVATWLETKPLTEEKYARRVQKAERLSREG